MKTLYYTHTHPFNGPLSRTTQVGRYQKGKINLDFTEARDSEWQWHQLGHIQVCTSLQTDNHASTPSFSFFTCRMPYLPPNQQRQSTEGTEHNNHQQYRCSGIPYRSQVVSLIDLSQAEFQGFKSNCLQCFDAVGWTAGRASGL